MFAAIPFCLLADGGSVGVDDREVLSFSDLSVLSASIWKGQKLNIAYTYELLTGETGLIACWLSEEAD